MVDASRAPSSGPPGIPRWVKALGIGAVVAVLVVVVVMVILGGEHGPGRHGPEGGAADQASPSAGASGGVGSPARADEATRRIEVTALDSMAFEPGSVDLSPGEVVTFVVTNAGETAHEFTLGDAAMQREHAEAMAHMPSGMAHELPNSIRLQPGETSELTWRFADAATIEYGCHEPGHYEAGMRGRVTVR